MFSSPFQQPSPRQNVLASQIQDAQRLGNERQLVLLSGQWVHRFGIDSLPVIDAASPEAEAESFDQLQPASVLATTAFTTTAFSEELVNPEDLGVSLDLVAQEFVPPMDSNDEETTVSQNAARDAHGDKDATPTYEQGCVCRSAKARVHFSNVARTYRPTLRPHVSGARRRA